jgi:aminoglycoside/choline kinase family phosphotransferase
VIEAATSQPQVLMHRDYHSANLMVLPNQQVGLLDFQDAFIGPLTYDLVSLLRDCYVSWPAEQVLEWALYYWQTWQKAGGQQVDAATFLRWFDWMGIERHIKALYTFARKAVQDQDDRYLKHIPRTLNYICDISARYSELQTLHQFYANEVRVALARWETVSCVE